MAELQHKLNSQLCRVSYVKVRTSIEKKYDLKFGTGIWEQISMNLGTLEPLNSYWSSFASRSSPSFYHSLRTSVIIWHQGNNSELSSLHTSTEIPRTQATHESVGRKRRYRQNPAKGEHGPQTEPWGHAGWHQKQKPTLPKKHSRENGVRSPREKVIAKHEYLYPEQIKNSPDTILRNKNVLSPAPRPQVQGFVPRSRPKATEAKSQGPEPRSPPKLTEPLSFLLFF